MCTIMTLSHDLWNSAAYHQVMQDSMSNDDGWSLLLTDGLRVTTVLKTMDLSMVLNTLETQSWDRMFLHSRMATQGKATVQNAHAWESGGVFYMHNGMIWTDHARSLEVDSMIIGHWLKYGVDNALDKLIEESFANVFLVDTNRGEYVVTRSGSGNLHTDGQGNYSTHPFGTLYYTVPPGFEFHAYRNLPRLQAAS